MEYNGYLIEKGPYVNYVVKPKGKGSVPKELRGLYTTDVEAKKAIDFSLEAKANGKTRSTK